MACTIDHLRVDHHVTVRRGFTDLAGVTLRDGDAGILRGLGMDTARMEVWIELERERGGARDRLRFALRAPAGPRVGHMTDYFEMGEPAGETSAGATPPPKTTPQEPERPRSSPAPPAGQQAPSDSSLGELRVACGCDPALHRELLPARGELSVFACLGCGTVTCSRSFGDDGRFTGNSWQENRTVALPDPVLRWIARWPRVKVDHTGRVLWPMSADYVRYPTLYYPADTRCAGPTQLAELEIRLTREQSGQSPAARLRATHRVKSAPPPDLPEDLLGYGLLWQALQLRPRSEVADLLHHAQPRSPGCEVAAEIVRQRPDAFDLLVSALRSPDATQRGAGFVIARDWRPADPRLAGVLIELMNGFSFERRSDMPQGIVSRGRFELVLLLIAELKLDPPEMLATLRTLMRKFARHDDFLVDCVRIVQHELDPTVPAPRSGGPTLP